MCMNYSDIIATLHERPLLKVIDNIIVVVVYFSCYGYITRFYEECRNYVKPLFHYSGWLNKTLLL